ncbi:MAG: cardiolipin synthase ClsB [Burkholderiales bacterium]|nr:cardiolipin synthase ClsB [Burkholderiales bacterium]
MSLQSRFRIVPGNRIILLKNGAEFFPALIRAIDVATAEVRLETYIFSDDVAGSSIAEALKRAAGRNVKVQVLIDGVGSYYTREAFFDDMRRAGIAILVFRPERRVFNLKKSRLRRVHRKIALIDGRVGFVGGINLIDDMTQSMSDFPRYDYAVQVEGPVLADIYLSMARLWRTVSWWKFGQRDKSFPRPSFPAHVPASLENETKKGDTDIFFAIRDNFRHRRDIEKAYLGAVGKARREILITSPYFLPGRHFRRALIAATKRGVRVILLLQGRADHAMLQQATRALYTQLLGAGIRIFEYHHSMLHGKVAVVDEDWSTVGSSNLDPFSLFLNREANVVVIDKRFSANLRTSVMEEIHANATQLDPTDWQKRGWMDRASSWIAYGFARWVMGWMGFARRWD